MKFDFSKIKKQYEELSPIPFSAIAWPTLGCAVLYFLISPAAALSTILFTYLMLADIAFIYYSYEWVVVDRKSKSIEYKRKAIIRLIISIVILCVVNYIYSTYTKWEVDVVYFLSFASCMLVNMLYIKTSKKKSSQKKHKKSK